MTSLKKFVFGPFHSLYGADRMPDRSAVSFYEHVQAMRDVSDPDFRLPEIGRRAPVIEATPRTVAALTICLMINQSIDFAAAEWKSYFNAKSIDFPINRNGFEELRNPTFGEIMEHVIRYPKRYYRKYTSAHFSINRTRKTCRLEIIVDEPNARKGVPERHQIEFDSDGRTTLREDSSPSGHDVIAEISAFTLSRIGDALAEFKD